MLRALFALLLLSVPAHAEGERSGEFDYYVMALSWTPSWCDYEGDRRGSPQCDAGTGHGFTLHGLWPQFNDGSWPSYCRTSHRNPSRTQTGAMADIMGTGGLAWHQWNKHGVCSGVSATDYFELSRKAYDGFNRPEIFRQLKNDIDLPASVVEQAFLEANPTLLQNQITVTCKAGRIQEARVCLDKDLNLTKCGTRAPRDCTLQNAQMDAMR